MRSRLYRIAFPSKFYFVANSKDFAFEFFLGLRDSGLVDYKKNSFEQEAGEKNPGLEPQKITLIQGTRVPLEVKHVAIAVL